MRNTAADNRANSLKLSPRPHQKNGWGKKINSFVFEPPLSEAKKLDHERGSLIGSRYRV